MNWPSAPLGRVARAVGGGTPSKQNGAFWNGTIPWVSPKDMSGRDIRDAEDHITEAAVDGSATQVVPVGSVLVVVRSGILVRRLPIAIARVPVALNQDMKALLPGGPLLPEFLAYALEVRADYVLSDCVKRGATVHSVDMGKFIQIQLPVPSPSEQRRIVELLEQADALRRLRAEADAKVDRILPALFLKMFGDPATNPMGWAKKPMVRILKTPPRNGLSPSSSGEVPGRVLTLSAITGPIFDESAVKDALFAVQPGRDKFVSDGDFHICRGNGSLHMVGKGRFPSRSMPDTVFPDTIIAVELDPEQIDKHYVELLWDNPYMRREIEARARTTNGIHKINHTAVETIELLVPPIELQRRFGTYAERLPIAMSKQASMRLNRIFDTLLRRAFSGDLTAKWREAHMNDLLQEMEQQARYLAGPSPSEARA